jgi:hypothetical protein
VTCFNPWPKGESFYKQDVIVPKALEKEAKVKKLKKSDETENVEVKDRSKGQCEITWFGKKARTAKRCEKRASQIHHMYGGSGVRARGKSILAKHKQHTCERCHDWITRKILRRIGTEERLWTDEYEHQGK